MTTIYLVQHGVAISKEIDEERPLSDIGIKETRQIAEILKKKNIIIQKIAHSGKLRALQTASIFSDILNVSDVCQVKGMKPNDGPDVLIQQMTDDAVMYIGHLPNVQNVVSSLVSGDKVVNVLQFQNSAVACVELQESEAHIKWFLTPDLS